GGEAWGVCVWVVCGGVEEGLERTRAHPTPGVVLNDPQAPSAFDRAGLDAAATRLDPPPAFASAQMATDMAEVYWRSLTRDVPFRDYETHPLVAAAVTELNPFTEPLTTGAGEEPAPATWCPAR